MTFQTVRHVHYQQGRNTRPLADVLNLLQDHGDGNNNEIEIVTIVLIGSGWDSKYYETLTWDIIFWSLHVYTDDELAPMLFDNIPAEEDELDEGEE